MTAEGSPMPEWKRRAASQSGSPGRMTVPPGAVSSSSRDMGVTLATVGDIATGPSRPRLVDVASILYIGGTGTISAACVRRSVALGHDVTVLNRGSGRRPLPGDVRRIEADVRDAASMRDALGDAEFDVVAEFLAFTPDHVAADLDLFEGRTGQYVFISSASAYEKPP